MTLGRSTSGINKVAGAGTAHEQISSTDAVQRASPTTVSSYPQFRGWICQETLCARSSVTFEAMRGLSPWVGERQSVGEGGGLAGRHRIERCGRQDDVGDGDGPGITVSGRWDDASESSPDAVLSSIVGRPAAVQYRPTGNASGQRRVAGRFVCLSYQISSRSGHPVRFEARFR